MSGSPSLFRGYDTRTYNLVANVAQSLPSAREFMIISATIDITALNFSLGDDNGDQEIWPFGVIIGIKEGSVKARIGSTVNQTVVIAMLDGDVTVKDNRFAPGAGSLAVTEADGANAALGAKADASALNDVGTFSLIALFKRMLTRMGPVTATDGALITLGTTTDASAPADNSNVSLIALFKRMLSKMGPVTSVDGGLVSIGATTDAAAPSDGATATLISLFKRLLQKTANTALPYGASFSFNNVAGAAAASTTIVAAGANVNGILLSSYSFVCGADTTAFFELRVGAGVVATGVDSTVVTLGAPITVPAGSALTYYSTGRVVAAGTYLVL